MRQTVAVGVIKSVEKTEKGGKGEFKFKCTVAVVLTLLCTVTKSAEKAAKKK